MKINLSQVKKISLLLFGIGILALQLNAIESHIETSIDTTLGMSSDSTPFWLQSNRWGTIPSDDLFGILGYSIKDKISLNSSLSITGATSFALYGTKEQNFQLREGYLEVSWNFLSLKGGMFREIIGILPEPELSSGSMSVSGNASPIPKIELSTIGFVSIPFTENMLQFKAGYTHGWMTGERYVELPLLHEKWFYLKLDREVINIHLGLVHQVMWGGEHPKGETLPVTWENYLRVVFGMKGGSDASVSDQLNMAGNGLGIWDVGMELPFPSFKILLYKHHYFEDGQKFWALRNFEDGLWGLGILLGSKKSIIQTIIWEYVNTMYQSGEYHDLGFLGRPDIILGGRDSYYTHGEYLSGWTHNGRVIGNPFFLVSGEGENLRIAGNRFRAFHVGLKGLIWNEWNYLFKASYLRHHFPYTSSDTVPIVESVSESKSQIYFLLSIYKYFKMNNKNLKLIISSGYDIGEINNSLGLLIELKLFL